MWDTNQAVAIRIKRYGGIANAMRDTVERFEKWIQRKEQILSRARYRKTVRICDMYRSLLCE